MARRGPAQAALVAGEVDYYESPPIDLPPLMESNPDLKIAIIDPLGTQGILCPNHLHPPLNLLPMQGYVSFKEGLLPCLKHLILPSLTHQA
jgi:hypothetical protein